MEKFTQTNAIAIINKIIIAQDEDGLNSIFKAKPVRLKKGGVRYEAFVPTVGGDEPLLLMSALWRLGFRITFEEADYFWRMRHDKSGARVQYIEGDFYLYLRK